MHSFSSIFKPKHATDICMKEEVVTIVIILLILI